MAQSEGGLVPNRTGSFATGKSFWPFQLHYGGKGYEQFGTTAGMGNTFTAQTGYQPGDPSAWRAATDYALDAAQKNGWGAWYGARNVGVTGRQGIGAAPAPAPVTDRSGGAEPWARDLLSAAERGRPGRPRASGTHPRRDRNRRHAGGRGARGRAVGRGPDAGRRGTGGTDSAS